MIREINNSNTGMVYIEGGPEKHGRNIQHISKPGHSEAVMTENRHTFLGMIQNAVFDALVLIAKAFQKRIRFFTDTLKSRFCITMRKGERFVPFITKGKIFLGIFKNYRS